MDIALFKLDSPTAKPLEVSGGGYLRVATNFDAGGHNISDVIFPTATSDWGRVDRVAAYQDNRLLYAQDLNPAVYVFAGDIVMMPIGALGLAGCGSPQIHETPETTTLTKLAAEDLIVGNVVYITDEDKLALAYTAAGIAEASAVGFATSNTLANNLASYNTDGFITRTSWSAVAGSSYLIPGTRYYLSATPGMITSIAPTTGYSVAVGQAIYADTLDIEIAQVIILA